MKAKGGRMNFEFAGFAGNFSLPRRSRLTFSSSFILHPSSF